MKFSSAFSSVASLVGTGAFGYMAVQNYDINHQSDVAPEWLRTATEVVHQIALALTEAGVLGIGAGLVGHIIDLTVDCIRDKNSKYTSAENTALLHINHP